MSSAKRQWSVRRTCAERHGRSMDSLANVLSFVRSRSFGLSADRSIERSPASSTEGSARMLKAWSNRRTGEEMGPKMEETSRMPRSGDVRVSRVSLTAVAMPSPPASTGPQPQPRRSLPSLSTSRKYSRSSRRVLRSGYSSKPFSLHVGLYSSTRRYSAMPSPSAAAARRSANSSSVMHLTSGSRADGSK